MDENDILTIDRFTWNLESFGALSNLPRSRFAIMSVLVVKIILADVDHRQLPQGRHIHAFVKQTLPERALAEEADRDLVATSHFGRHGRAGGDPRASAHDGVGAQIARLLIGDVHRATFAAAIPRRFSQQLRKHAVERSAFGQTMAVASMRARDVVVLPQGFAHTHSDRLLTDV